MSTGSGRFATNAKSMERNVKPMPNMMMPSSGVTCPAKPDAVSGKKKPNKPPIMTSTGNPSAAMKAARSSRAVAFFSASVGDVDVPAAGELPALEFRESFITPL